MLSVECDFHTGLSITPSTGPFAVGDELTCVSSSFGFNYLISYYVDHRWSGTTGIGTGDEDAFAYSDENPFTLPGGPFVLTCTAIIDYYNEVEEACTKTTTIMDTAYSKYHKHKVSYVLSNTVSDQSFCRRPYNNFTVRIRIESQIFVTISGGFRLGPGGHRPPKSCPVPPPIFDWFRSALFLLEGS